MIKRFTTMVVMTVCTLIGFQSCAAKQENKETNIGIAKDMNTEDKLSRSALNEGSKKLVVFFSHTGENYNVGVIEKGNTHIVADMIAEATGADTFEIKPEKAYPFNYDECIDVAKKELQQKARPAVQGDVKVEDYDVIFIGYPQWWGEPPMCLYTFIEKHDWNGKTVIPFVTHEGSGMGGTDRKIAVACEGANTAVGKGLAIQGKVAQTQRDSTRRTVNNWLEGLGFKK